MNSTLATFFSIVVGFDVGYCFEPAACRLVTDECGCYDGSPCSAHVFSYFKYSVGQVYFLLKPAYTSNPPKWLPTVITFCGD